MGQLLRRLQHVLWFRIPHRIPFDLLWPSLFQHFHLSFCSFYTWCTTLYSSDAFGLNSLELNQINRFPSVSGNKPMGFMSHSEVWVNVCDTSEVFYLRRGVSSAHQPVLHCNYSVSISARLQKTPAWWRPHAPSISVIIVVVFVKLKCQTQWVICDLRMFHELRCRMFDSQAVRLTRTCLYL